MNSDGKRINNELKRCLGEEAVAFPMEGKGLQDNASEELTQTTSEEPTRTLVASDANYPF